MSQSTSPIPDEVTHANPIHGKELRSDSSRNDWLPVDFLECLATTVDLRIVLFHVQEASSPSLTS